MAFSVTQRVISSEDMIYSYCDDFCRKAKLLYNAALFRIRQVFTGWDKGDNRTPLEQSVFDEIECGSCITRCSSSDPCPKSDLLQPSGEADACHGKSGFLYRTADADSTGDGKASCHRF